VTRQDLELLGCGALVGLALGALAGWWLHPPPPAPRVEVRTRELTDAERQALVRVVTVEGPERTVEGPVRIVERWRRVEMPPSVSSTPGCPEPEPLVCEEHERTEERGQVVTERATSTTVAVASSSSTEHHEERVVAVVTPPPPAPLPRWSLAGGVQVGTELQPRPVVGVGLRLLGPVWVEASVSPFTPSAAAGLRVAF
jgi:hypothetical protein